MPFHTAGTLHRNHYCTITLNWCRVTLQDSHTVGIQYRNHSHHYTVTLNRLASPLTLPTISHVNISWDMIPHIKSSCLLLMYGGCKGGSYVAILHIDTFEGLTSCGLYGPCDDLVAPVEVFHTVAAEASLTIVTRRINVFYVFS